MNSIINASSIVEDDIINLDNIEFVIVLLIIVSAMKDVSYAIYRSF